MKNYVSILVLLFSLGLFAQNETLNWYFGNNAAFNFKDGKIKVLENSAMNTPQGSASISDTNGNLLFYTNGETVWNKNHQIMENGDNLFGDKNNTQSTIIIPKPNSDSIYYVFSTKNQSTNSDGVQDPQAGLHYSEIEISNTYPLGKIINKNINLRRFTSERLTAVHHKDGKSIWLISVGKIDADATVDTFLNFKIDETGVSNAPISSTVEDFRSNKGQMKVSPDSKKIVVISFAFTVYVFDFDSETGIVKSNNIIGLKIDFGSGFGAFGVEFSQSSELLYISTAFFGGSFSYAILQHQMSEPLTGFDYPPIGKIIFQSSKYAPGSLQLAPNGKIYAALYENDSDGNLIPSSKIGVINNPEIVGEGANYAHDSQSVSPGFSSKGLPNFIQSYFASRIITENKCLVDEFSFSANSYSNITNIDWDFGDGTFANGINVKHIYSAPGNYNVKAILTVNNSKISIYKTVEVYSLPSLKSNQEIVECDDNMDGLSTFNLYTIKQKITIPSLDETLYFYENQTDLNNDNNRILNPENFNNSIPNQEIFVKVVNKNNCFGTTAFTVSARFVSLGTISDFYTCENSDGISGNQIGNFNGRAIATSIKDQLGISDRTSLKFYPSYIDAQTNTNELIGAFSSKTATIFVKAQEADFSCGGIQSFNVIVNPDPIINLQDTYSICFNPSLKPPVIISADASNDRYEWRNSQGNIISVSKDFTLDTVGEFSLTAYKAENGLLCSNSKTFVVETPEKAFFSNIEVNTEDETNNIVTVSIQGNSTYEFSLDNVNFTGNSSTFTFNNVEAGLRTIYVRDINNCEEPIFTEVAVIGFKEYFTPNDDGKNDYWNISGLNETSFRSINVRIFDRYGKLIHQITNFTSLGWDGTYNSEKLIANNYWFKADIIDKDNNLISKTGYFSLIRN